MVATPSISSSFKRLYRLRKPLADSSTLSEFLPCEFVRIREGGFAAVAYRLDSQGLSLVSSLTFRKATCLDSLLGLCFHFASSLNSSFWLRIFLTFERSTLIIG